MGSEMCIRDRDCWSPCGLGGERQGGACPTNFCGAGLCCRADPSHPFDDDECGESGCWGYHCCVALGTEAHGGPGQLSVRDAVFVAVVAGAGAIALVLCMLLLAKSDLQSKSRDADEAAAREAASALMQKASTHRGAPPPPPTPSTPYAPSPAAPVPSGRFTFLNRASPYRPSRFSGFARPTPASSREAQGLGRDGALSIFATPTRASAASTSDRGGLHTTEASAPSPWKVLLGSFSFRGAEEPDWLKKAESDLFENRDATAGSA